MTLLRREGPVAGIVLAAGASRRFGGPKQLLELEGESLLRRTARIARQAGLDPVVVVLDAAASETMRAELAGLAVEVAINPRPQRGMGSSLGAGLRACRAQPAAIAVLVSDQPGLQVDLLERLIEAWRRGEGDILRPRSGEMEGHPVIFDASLLPELQGRRGREVIAAHPEALAYVEVADPLTLIDTDEPEAWARFLRCREARGDD